MATACCVFGVLFLSTDARKGPPNGCCRSFCLCEDMWVSFMSCSLVFPSRYDGIAWLLRLQHAEKCLPVFSEASAGLCGQYMGKRVRKAGVALQNRLKIFLSHKKKRILQSNGKCRRYTYIYNQGNCYWNCRIGTDGACWYFMHSSHD